MISKRPIDSIANIKPHSVAIVKFTTCVDQFPGLAGNFMIGMRL